MGVTHIELAYADFLGTIHIGVAILSTENFVFLPTLASNSLKKLAERVLRVKAIRVTENIIGSLAVANSNGIAVSNVISDEVLHQLRKADLPIYKAPEFFAFGNVVLANDYGGIISPVVPKSIRDNISDVLDIPLEKKTLANSDLVGSLAFITNYGGLFTPLATEEEIQDLKDFLNLKGIGIGSVNKGSEFVASGILGNTKGILIGKETTGIEIMEITRSFSL